MGEVLIIHDIIEEILKKLPVKSLLRFKSVSKQWKSTIESHNFQEKHLLHHQNSKKKPDLLSIKTGEKSSSVNIITLESKSSISNTIPIPCRTNFYKFCQNSIDGLICLYNDKYGIELFATNSVIIFNPATRWYRTLPPSTYLKNPSRQRFTPPGFGKDQITGLYKPVWLYNSDDNMTTKCEVFDFKINAWRLIETSSPSKIPYMFNPVYLNGLLYWLTEKEEEEENISSVLSFDLHTETFEIVCKVPFEKYMTLQNLNNELCISDHMEYSVVIWSLNLEEKTWKKIYFIDFGKINCPFYKDCWCPVWPVDIIEENKKKKFILYDYHGCPMERIILYDSYMGSYHVVARGQFTKPICYFQSFISIL